MSILGHLIESHYSLKAMQSPLFSVVIPTINRIEEIQDTLKSLCQAKKNHHVEIILVDDCSGNDLALSSELVSNITLNYIKNPSRQGPGNSRDIGVRASAGDVICFVDSDDLVEINYFDVLAANISNRPNYTSIQFGSRDLVKNHSRDGQEYISSTVRKSEPIPGFFSRQYLVSFLSGNFPCECWQIAVNKKFYIQNEFCFPEGIHEDIEYWFAISTMSRGNVFIDLPLYNKVRTNGSIVNTLSCRHIDYYFRALNNVISLSAKVDPEVVELTILPVLNVAGSRLRRIKSRSVELIDSSFLMEEAICQNIKALYFNHFASCGIDLLELLASYGPKTRFQEEILFLSKIILKYTI